MMSAKEEVVRSPKGRDRDHAFQADRDSCIIPRSSQWLKCSGHWELLLIDQAWISRAVLQTLFREDLVCQAKMSRFYTNGL